ncbi:hypothetical protein F5148DRAFT_1175989 [Russula earlei]|uniref:Uncharacterized protein n=1 Tax=Russula earlei TaxID=71964 RepID=A0ACC0UGF5_9AGAM|nr:hypothetical protein F5148DRAFT_1175989 [Russula earlei]
MHASYAPRLTTYNAPPPPPLHNLPSPSTVIGATTSYAHRSRVHRLREREIFRTLCPRATSSQPPTATRVALARGSSAGPSESEDDKVSRVCTGTSHMCALYQLDHKGVATLERGVCTCTMFIGFHMCCFLMSHLVVYLYIRTRYSSGGSRRVIIKLQRLHQPQRTMSSMTPWATSRFIL